MAGRIIMGPETQIDKTSQTGVIGETKQVSHKVFPPEEWPLALSQRWDHAS